MSSALAHMADDPIDNQSCSGSAFHARHVEIAGWDQGQHTTGWGRTSMLLDTVALDDDMSMYMVLAPGQPGNLLLPPQVIGTLQLQFYGPCCYIDDSMVGM